MRIGQAIYGEKNRGHALIEASSNADIAKDIIGRMDIPGTLPPGTTWKPYITGFAHSDFYILARTSPDVAAERSGMVFSRAFILSLDDAIALDDIESLFAELRRRGDDRVSIEDIDWSTNSASASASPALAEELISEGPDPVVWPMQDGFEEAIAGLWRNLWPKARRGFSFGLAFRPQDVVSNPPSIVATPPELAARWSSFRQASTAPKSIKPPVALLIGDPTGDPLRELMDDLEAEIETISDLGTLAEIYEVMDSKEGLGDLIGALRASAYLCPLPSKGTAAKDMILKNACEAVKKADASEVLMARNLDLDAFKDAAGFWDEVVGWARSELWSTASPAELARILSSAYDQAGPVETWKSAVKKGVKNALKAGKANVIAALWTAILDKPTLIPLLMNSDKRSGMLENKLVECAPAKLSIKSIEHLHQIVASIPLMRLHAAIAAAVFAPSEAVKAHIASGKYDRPSLEISLKGAKPRERVEIAVQQADPALIEIAAAFAAKDPRLLSNLKITNQSWRNLWHATLALEPAAWEGPKKPRDAADALWSELAKGSKDGISLLRALAVTPLGDISEHPNRADLWAHIPDDFRSEILARTADGFIQTFLKDGSGEPPEEKLANELIAPSRRDHALDQLVTNPERAVAFFRLLPQINEGVFISWCDKLLTRTSSISAPASKSIGRLIFARQWRDAAKKLASYAQFQLRRDLLPALEICVDLIGYFNQLFLGIWSAPPTAARWQILEEIAIDLYPRGPDQNELWSRSGGKNGQLPIGGTGAEAWRHVISRAKNGKLDVEMSAMLKQMEEDYPANEILRKMRSDSLF